MSEGEPRREGLASVLPPTRGPDPCAATPTQSTVGISWTSPPFTVPSEGRGLGEAIFASSDAISRSTITADAGCPNLTSFAASYPPTVGWVYVLATPVCRGYEGETRCAARCEDEKLKSVGKDGSEGDDWNHDRKGRLNHGAFHTA